MYETVKVVKGYKITRMKGTRGAYHVNVREDDQIVSHFQNNQSGNRIHRNSIIKNNCKKSDKSDILIAKQSRGSSPGRKEQNEKRLGRNRKIL